MKRLSATSMAKRAFPKGLCPPFGLAQKTKGDDVFSYIDESLYIDYAINTW
jgi:hypothetical protein